MQRKRGKEVMKMVRVTVVNVERPVGDPDDMGSITGDGPDYFLPGANYKATVKALHDAGFKIVDSINKALEKALEDDG